MTMKMKNLSAFWEISSGHLGLYFGGKDAVGRVGSSFTAIYLLAQIRIALSTELARRGVNRAGERKRGERSARKSEIAG